MSHSPEYYVLRDRRYRDLSQPANEGRMQAILNSHRLFGFFGSDRGQVELLKKRIGDIEKKVPSRGKNKE